MFVYLKIEVIDGTKDNSIIQISSKVDSPGFVCFFVVVVVVLCFCRKTRIMSEQDRMQEQAQSFEKVVIEKALVRKRCSTR
jgi:hypothetical protein